LDRLTSCQDSEGATLVVEAMQKAAEASLIVSNNARAGAAESSAEAAAAGAIAADSGAAAADTGA